MYILKKNIFSSFHHFLYTKPYNLTMVLYTIKKTVVGKIMQEAGAPQRCQSVILIVFPV